MAHVGVDPRLLHSAWDEILMSGHLTEGRYVRLFEGAVEEWSGLHACAVNSAGTGLYTMLRLAGPKADRPVAVPANTFYATGAMARENGNPLLLVDANEKDLSMGLDALMALPVPPAAVILTHVGGGLAKDYAEIACWCAADGIPLFEDAAHALGTKNADGTVAGLLGHSAVFSLYPTKAVPAGEGGVIVSDDPFFIEACKEFRNYGKSVDNGVIRYGAGFNFRMDEWTAAVAFLQMQRLPEILAARQEAAVSLSRLISPIAGWDPGMVGNNFYKYPVERWKAKTLGLKKFAGHIYQSSDQLPTALGIHDQGNFPRAEYIADQLCCLPLDESLYRGQTVDGILKFLRS